MDTIKTIIEIIFSAALFINAILFIPQAINIIKKKTAEGVSILTFLGFLLIQLFIVLHALIKHDTILLYGYLLSMLTCGSVVLLIFVYKKRDSNSISLEAIFEQLPGHIYWKDEHGTMLGCNKNNMYDFGVKDIKDFIGKTDYDLFSKEEANQLRLIDEEVFREGKERLYEEKVTNSDGTKALYLSFKKPLVNTKQDKIGILGYSLQINDLKNKHNDHVAMLENIIAKMPGKVYWMNRDGVYLGCNDNEAEALGLTSRHEIIGKRNADLPGFLIAEELDPVNEKIMSTGEPITLQEPATNPDGSIATYLSSKVPLKNHHNDVIGLLGISIDITDRIKKEDELKNAKEKAEEAVLIKNDFIKNIEHDLRTPFSGLLGLSELLLEMESDPNKKDMVEQIVLAAKQLLDYHNKVLDFSKINTGKLPISYKKFNLKALIESIISIERPAAMNKGIEILYDFDSDIPHILIGDEYRVNRILLNLIGNAIKFTNTGNVSLNINKANCNDNKIILDFVIKDTGIGIPKDKQQYIFDQFTRLNPSNEGEYNGLGIGLKIVKEFTKDLNGDIDLYSEVNKGTKYFISLPFQVPLTQTICNSLD